MAHLKWYITVPISKSIQWTLIRWSLLWSPYLFGVLILLLINVKQRLNSINGHMSCGCHLPAFTLWKLLFPSEFDVSWETLELGKTCLLLKGLNLECRLFLQCYQLCPWKQVYLMQFLKHWNHCLLLILWYALNSKVNWLDTPTNSATIIRP